MRREIRVDGELNFSEILGVLVSKLKLLFCIFLIGCVCGAGLGVWSTYGQNVYGTSVVFFVNPIKSENEEEEEQTTGGVNGAYGKTLMETMMQFLSTERFADTLMCNMTGAPNENEKTDENGNLTANYKNYIKKIKNAVSFTCSNNANTDSVEAETASSFVYVKISVVGDENVEFARELLSRIETEVPIAITTELHVPDNFERTDCRMMTIDDEIKLMNPGYTRSTAIRYAILLGLASLIVAVVVVILVEKADKRLKNLDFISEKLDLPILAIVPSIKLAEKNETEANKK